MSKHNHVTRDIKPLGQCPACDEYHDRHIPKSEVKVREITLQFKNGIPLRGMNPDMGAENVQFIEKSAYDKAIEALKEAREEFQLVASQLCFNDCAQERNIVAAKRFVNFIDDTLKELGE